jgi:hypothetical protein
LTGQAVNSTSGSGSTLLANSVDVASRRSTGASAFYGLSALELLGVVLVPPVAYAFVQRRRRAERKAAS